MYQVWKVSPLGRFGVLALIALLGTFTWLAWGNVFVSLLAGLGGLVSWFRFAFRPAVTLTDTDVIVRNPNGSQQVSLSDVAKVEPGYGGLTITTSTGEHVVAWAVQKSNLAKWTGRHTRADEVAASITAASRSRAVTR
ncbi:PH domain-containing protein [Micromonospora trifolii]|uniref:PH domain-containing protein n=1 Tax=Micromonospora trifolii TaxID=2911208 RepID=UPI003D2ECE45